VEGDEGEGDRSKNGRANALHSTGGDELARVLGKSAGQARRPEDDQPGQQRPAPPDQIADPAPSMIRPPNVSE